MKAFKAPKTSLGDLDAEAAAILITAAADIAIIVDATGAVRDVAFNSEGLSEELAGQESWLGKPWIDTVAPDSRAKVESLLGDSDAGAGRSGGSGTGSPVDRCPQSPHPSTGTDGNGGQPAGCGAGFRET